MKHKSYPATIKSLDGEGSGSAVFATLGVKDHDGDVLVKGCVGVQAIKISPAHRWDEPSIGVGSTREEGDQAIVDFKFNLSMDSGKEWYESLKFNHENGIQQQWSFGFNVSGESRGDFNGENVRFLKSLTIFEASPVMLAAGIGTGTRNIKASGEMRGSWESVQDAVREAASALYLPNPVTPDGSCAGWVCLEGTYDNTAVACVYNYASDGDGPRYFQFDWSLQPDGTVVISNSQEVELQVVVTQKSFQLDPHISKTVAGVLGLNHRLKALVALKQSEAKVGRTLSQANRDRLSRFGESVTQGITALTQAAADVNALLAEADALAASVDPAVDGKSQEQAIQTRLRHQKFLIDQARGRRQLV